MNKKDMEQVKENTFLNNMFYDDELEEADNKSNNSSKIKNTIKELAEDETLKNKMLADDYFISLLEHINVKDVIEDRLYEIYDDYIAVKEFFEDEKAFDILAMYETLIYKNEAGEYQLNKEKEDIIIQKLLTENGYNVKDIENYKKIILNMWENKQEIISPKNIDILSEKRNGINLKYFLFCEEYIKTGRITDTAQNLGIGRRTCYDYLQKEEVKKYLSERQEEIKTENTELMKNRFNECFEELYCMGTKTAFIDDNIKVKALDTFLKHYENSILRDCKVDEN